MAAECSPSGVIPVPPPCLYFGGSAAIRALSMTRRSTGFRPPGRRPPRSRQPSPCSEGFTDQRARVSTHRSSAHNASELRRMIRLSNDSACLLWEYNAAQDNLSLTPRIDSAYADRWTALASASERLHEAQMRKHLHQVSHHTPDLMATRRPTDAYPSFPIVAVRPVADGGAPTMAGPLRLLSSRASGARPGRPACWNY